MVKAWNGGTVICSCKSENVEYVRDVHHGSLSDCAEYKCLDCGEIFHVELPN